MKKRVVIGLVLALIFAIVIISIYQKPEVLPAPEVCVDDKFSYTDFKEIIKQYESVEEKVYDDGLGHLTIGVGHKIKKDSRDIFRDLLKRTDYDDIIKGRTVLTSPEIEKLLDYDIDIRLGISRGIFKHYNRYPNYLQYAILNGVFRDDINEVNTPNTIRILKAAGELFVSADNHQDLIPRYKQAAEKYNEAALEYLNRRDYNFETAAIAYQNQETETNKLEWIHATNEYFKLRYKKLLGETEALRLASVFIEERTKTNSELEEGEEKKWGIVRGIVKRMEWNRDQMKKFAEFLNSPPK
jgi:hypothetical protein